VAAEVKETSLVELITKSDNYEAFVQGRSKSTGKIEIKAATGVILTNNPYPARPDRIAGIQYATTYLAGQIRTLFTQGTTGASAIEFVQEQVALADIQAAVAPEGSLKKQSKLDFVLQTVPVVTIAHWINASRQVLDDQAQLESYIGSRLMYGLAVEEDDQLMNGSGANGEINGLINNAYDAVEPASNDLDAVLLAIAEIAIGGGAADAVLMSPMDYAQLSINKTTTGEYLLMNPTSGSMPSLFGLKVVVSAACARGVMYVGAFKQAATLFDRQQSNIEMSRENQDNFVRNMVTILAEQRLALAFFNTTLIRKVTLQGTATTPAKPAVATTKPAV
jgi:HK97 family phage major capsid protein